MYNNYVPRPRPTQFDVKQAKPRQGKCWKVTGYVDGVPKISWYSTEKETREACKEFNVQLAAHGSDLVMSTTDFDATSNSGLSSNQPHSFEGEHHLVNRRWADAEVMRMLPDSGSWKPPAHAKIGRAHV